MSLVLTSGPALEPVSLAEAKAHLRLETNDDDTLLQSLITTSRLHIEAALGLALLTQSWSWMFDHWPRGERIVLPLRPVQAITHVRVWRQDGTSEILPADSFILDGQGNPARPSPVCALARWSSRPGGPPTASRSPSRPASAPAAADVPATIRQALLLLVAHWYEHREPVEIGASMNAVPVMVSELLHAHRRRRL